MTINLNLKKALIILTIYMISLIIVFAIGRNSKFKSLEKSQIKLEEELNETDIPVKKTWRLNERHYGALQGLNKQETAEKFGDDQVKIWRRSYSRKNDRYKR